MNKKTMNKNAVILLIIGIAIAVTAYMFFFKAEAEDKVTITGQAQPIAWQGGGGRWSNNPFGG